jgi:hypothetical protein
MSVFYLKHRKHGTKVATEESEVEFDKKRGWEEYDLEEMPKKPETLSLKKSAEAAL